MLDDNFQWEEMYKKIKGRQPRPLLLDVLSHFGDLPRDRNYQAIDLGCGDGTESAYLLSKGWHTLAIDSEPIAFDYLKTLVPPNSQNSLETQVATLEEVELPPADLVYAGYSLPYCHPQHFPRLWNKIVNSLNRGGYFAGQFFGPKDTWASKADMTFLTAEQTRALFTAFEIEQFDEEDEDGESEATIGPKHWHIFHVIAHKL